MQRIPRDIAVGVNDIGLKLAYQAAQACIHARVRPAALSKVPDGNAARMKQRFETARELIVERNHDSIETGPVEARRERQNDVLRPGGP
jgi:hypothetical protein